MKTCAYGTRLPLTLTQLTASDSLQTLARIAQGFVGMVKPGTSAPFMIRARSRPTLR
jgi:hypothetical protein